MPLREASECFASIKISCRDKLANFVLAKEISAVSKVTSEARSLDHVSHNGSARVREPPPYQHRNLGCAFQFCANVRENLEPLFSVSARLVDDCECEREKEKATV